METTSRIECPHCGNWPEKVWNFEIGTVYESQCFECENEFEVVFEFKNDDIIQITSED